MNKNGLTLVSFLLVVILMVFVGAIKPALALTPFETTLGSNRGFITGTKTLSISSAAAVKCPNMPSGAHEVWAMSVNAFNYGDSAISTATSELFVATLTVKVFDKLLDADPGTYFRCRDVDTVATITFQYR